ncbi:hypothetical protein D1115_23045 (plasmid) [Vibrio alfacsensis]|uniref:Uncharacterized protein n=1 Tax=Vibrio alfacsensis TaxID=1074311 RepID=A0ABN5PNZ3_9VIBR|nr:hypothetical protein D1115_23045 [Vibrio alfacsensis]
MVVPIAIEYTTILSHDTANLSLLILLIYKKKQQEIQNPAKTYESSTIPLTRNVVLLANNNVINIDFDVLLRIFKKMK